MKSHYFLWLIIICTWSHAAGTELNLPDDAFDGSFLLETGEIITGGFFPEGGQRQFLYMDTDGLSRGGLFERIKNRQFRSIYPPGVTKLTFTDTTAGIVNQLVWSTQGQEPVIGTRTSPHQSLPVSFPSTDGTTLQGRLLVPVCAGEGPYPLVVSVHGSGPVSRYAGPYHTFFLRQGMAVLAYDKRGYPGAKDTPWQEPDLQTLTADAVAAMRHGVKLPGIDSQRVGFFGSSQAGWVIPGAAVGASESKFMILRAGAATRHLETHLHEKRQELRMAGVRGLDLDQAIDLRREVYLLSMQGASLSDTDALLDPWLKTPWYTAAFGEGLISSRWSEYWWSWSGRNFKSDPGPMISRFGGSILWFLAGNDENVPLVATHVALQQAFAASQSTDQQIVVIEHALHSFLVPGDDGQPRFADGFFNRMTDWLEQRGLNGQSCATDRDG